MFLYCTYYFTVRIFVEGPSTINVVIHRHMVECNLTSGPLPYQVATVYNGRVNNMVDFDTFSCYFNCIAVPCDPVYVYMCVIAMAKIHQVG